MPTITMTQCAGDDPEGMYWTTRVESHHDMLPAHWKGPGPFERMFEDDAQRVTLVLVSPTWSVQELLAWADHLWKDFSQWRAGRDKQRVRGLIGVAVRRENAERAGPGLEAERLRLAVSEARAKDPEAPVNAIAENLLPRFGGPRGDKKKAINALRQRIARLDKKT